MDRSKCPSHLLRNILINVLTSRARASPELWQLVPSPVCSTRSTAALCTAAVFLRKPDASRCPLTAASSRGENTAGSARANTLEEQTDRGECNKIQMSHLANCNSSKQQLKVTLVTSCNPFVLNEFNRWPIPTYCIFKVCSLFTQVHSKVTHFSCKV